MRLVLAVIGVASVAACSRGTSETRPQVLLDAASPLDAGAPLDAARAVVPLAVPPVLDASVGSGECAGSDIDLVRALANPSCVVKEIPGRPLAADLASKLHVTLASDRAVVAPGAELELTVRFENTTNAPLSLLFTLNPPLGFDVLAFDGADQYLAPEGTRPCPVTRAVPKAARIVLAPHGIARARTAWRASRFRWARDEVGSPFRFEYCPIVPARELAEGRYMLSIATPLLVGNDAWSSPRLDASGHRVPLATDAGVPPAPSTLIDVRR